MSTPKPNLPIYLDNAATTPVDPRVAEMMSKCLTQDGVFANPASRSHIYGWQAEEQVELARRNVAELIHSDPREIVWTSGATESNNLALKGVFFAHAEQQGKGSTGATSLGSLNLSAHLITSSAEHKAIVDTAQWLEKQGVAVTWLQPNAQGFITADQVQGAIKPDTLLVSLMLVNNETGVINPIAEIGAACKQADVLLHSDAAQAVGKILVDVENLNVDLLSLSAHKFYGPKGVGALYVKRSAQRKIEAIIHGGGHERGMRSGTLPTHQLAGMGEAARIAKESLPDEMKNIAVLRDKLWSGIADLHNVSRNACTGNVSPNHLNVCFHQVDGEALLMSFRQLAISSGSACTSATMEPSYVLKAMGMSDEDAYSSIRISLGRFTTEAEIQQAIAHIRQVVSHLNAA